ncbi:MAG: nitroreductase family protein [Chloroflexi bacterium]|nr:nitroreductase family protein [Chloroflexota bacterium]
MVKRRSVRHFSSAPVPLNLIENAIRVAGSAPSGANQQPWTFAVISDPALKRKIRAAAEAEEKESYERRMTPEWLAALAVLGTDWRKPHIEDAPYVIVVFRQAYGIRQNDAGQDERVMHYYSEESVGIAVGFLLAALHISGLATLTHTPSPMKFLAEILGRPANERPYILIPVGYPAEDAEVPVISKKPLDEIMISR